MPGPATTWMRPPAAIVEVRGLKVLALLASTTSRRRA
jgi:hypothetical protein